MCVTPAGPTSGMAPVLRFRHVSIIVVSTWGSANPERTMGPEAIREGGAAEGRLAVNPNRGRFLAQRPAPVRLKEGGGTPTQLAAAALKRGHAAGRFQEHLEDARPVAPDKRISAPCIHAIFPLPGQFAVRA
jgi:hypothetical protein